MSQIKHFKEPDPHRSTRIVSISSLSGLASLVPNNKILRSFPLSVRGVTAIPSTPVITVILTHFLRILSVSAQSDVLHSAASCVIWPQLSPCACRCRSNWLAKPVTFVPGCRDLDASSILPSAHCRNSHNCRRTRVETRGNAFKRGKKSGPILSSLGAPFLQGWQCIQPVDFIILCRYQFVVTACRVRL